MRQRMLTTLGRWAGEKTWWMLAFVVVATMILGAMAGQLKMTMDLTSLLPGDDPMVDEFNYITEEFNGASTIFIVIEGEPDDMVAYADHVSPLIKDLEGWIETEGSSEVKSEYRVAMDNVTAGKAEYAGHYIERVEYRQLVDFMRNHGLMLVKPKDLENMREVYTDPNLLPFLTNLNNSLEKEYIQSEEKISTTQREFMAVAFLDGIESWVDLTSAALLDQDYDASLAPAAADAIGLGVPYFTSPDRTMMLVMVEPTFNIMEMDHVLPVINGIEELVKAAAPEFNVKAGLAGGMALGRDEYVAGMEDSFLLTILALVAVFVLFVVTFRMLSSPILAMLNLIIGITWAMGVAWLLVGVLNMFTAMMAVVLVGLGIDFSIHIISVFAEHLNKGVESKQAMVQTLQKVGSGIMTGGFTTAAAFLTLMIGRSKGISEFGLVCGMGLIVVMISTLIIVPTLIMARQRYRDFRGKVIKQTRDITYAPVGRLGQSIYDHWKVSLAGMIVLTGFFVLMASRLTMDYNYLNMEPVGLESIELGDKVIEKFNFSPDVTMMTAKSLDENQRFTEKAKGKAHVSYVESITDYLPMAAEQARRKPGILEIAASMGRSRVASTVTAAEWQTIRTELERLEMNVIEMQDMAFMGGQDNVDAKATRLVGNPDQPEVLGSLSSFIGRLDEQSVSLDRLSRLNRDFGEEYRDVVLDMADTTTITLEMLPSIIRDKHVSRDGSRYLLTIYPKGNVWDIEYLSAFAEEMLDITPAIAGTPPMFYFLLQQVGEDGRRASLLTILVVLLFLWADFRSLKHAILAMIPLVFGIVWMVGFMGLTGIQITLLNIIAIPLILGIGIDDGVHIMHRYRIEGLGALDIVYRSTGKAIIITSLTTMLAFGSLVFATYRGFGSMGLALFIGVGACLATSLLVLPAVLALAERKR